MERRVTKIKVIEGTAKEFEEQYYKWASQGYELDPHSISRIEYVGKIYHVGIMYLPLNIEDQMNEEVRDKVLENDIDNTIHNLENEAGKQKEEEEGSKA